MPAVTKADLAKLVQEQAEAIAALQADAKGKPAEKAKAERKLTITTAREWTGSNTMLATYRQYVKGGKVKRGARLYREELDAILSEFGIKPDKEQREAIAAFYAPMSQDD